jgi:hypothetical protein
MAFMKQSQTIIAFASYDDVYATDQRVFESNEGLTEDIVETATIRATERILTLLKNSDWWRDLNNSLTPGLQFDSNAALPNVNANNIVARQDDFTDLCVFYALYYYLLPKVADFAREDNAERAKIGFYQEKYNFLFTELVNTANWYDFNGDGTVAVAELRPGHQNLVRIR